MELLGSPLITMVLNIVATGLVARGILDVHTKDMFIQLVDNALAAGVTLFVALYSIYKMVDLHKHRITVSSPSVTVTQSSPTSTMLPMTQPIATVKSDSLFQPAQQPVVIQPMQQIDQNGLTGQNSPVVE